MPIIFYPYEDDLKKGVSSTLDEKLEILLEAAERYKAIVLDSVRSSAENGAGQKRTSPADLKVAYNWDGISQVLREIRDLPESTPADKHQKGDRLMKLAEIYEVLRAARMPKLEAVRLSLVNEAGLLRGGTSVGG